MNLDTPTRARLPLAALAQLSDLRARPDLEVLPFGPVLWLRWRLDVEAIVLRLLPLPEVALFEARGKQWFPAGRLLPTSVVPDDRLPGWKHLSAVLFPQRIDPLQNPLAGWANARLRLVPSDQVRPARALRADFAVVQTWAETALTGDLAQQRATWTPTEVLLVSEHLPPLQPARRYHGQRVLLPLGYRVEPNLPEEALVVLLGLARGEIALLDDAAVDILEESCLTPLSRAALRRAAHQRQET